MRKNKELMYIVSQKKDAAFQKYSISRLSVNSTFDQRRRTSSRL